MKAAFTAYSAGAIEPARPRTAHRAASKTTQRRRGPVLVMIPPPVPEAGQYLDDYCTAEFTASRNTRKFAVSTAEQVLAGNRRLHTVAQAPAVAKIHRE